MNVKANQYLLEMPEVSSLVVAPSCGDESLAIGNVVYGYAKKNNYDLSGISQLTDIYLGSSYDDIEIKKEGFFSWKKQLKLETGLVTQTNALLLPPLGKIFF
jgi:predicted NodU family carbamoyl transferase